MRSIAMSCLVASFVAVGCGSSDSGGTDASSAAGSGAGAAAGAGGGSAGSTSTGKGGSTSTGKGGSTSTGGGGTGGSGTAGSAGTGTGGTGTAGSAGTGTGGTGTAGSGTGGTGTAGSGVAGTGGTGVGGSGTGGTGTGGMGAGGFTVVITIVLENHDYKEVVGSANAPYINSLIDQGALATNYMDSGVHPSLPNYLYMLSGQTFVKSDIGPKTAPFPSSADNLAAQMTSKGVAWRAYMESMGTPCGLSDKGTYAPRHNPFVYFTSLQGDPSCQTVDVDYTSFAGDLDAGKTQFMWITPNLLSDGHDPSANPVQGLKQSDAWLATEIPKIMDSAVYKAGGVIFLTWDEAEGRNGDSPDQIPMIVLSPKVKPGTKSATAFSHASYLATIEDLYGLPRLGEAAKAKNMFELFTPLALRVLPLPIELPYVDEHLVVANKPSGLLMHRGMANDDDVLLFRVRDALGQHVYAVNRLDRGTSGVVLLARSAEMAAALGAELAAQRTEKRYLALVRGAPPDEGTIDHPVPRSEDGDRVAAVTWYRTVARSTVARCSLVEARPKTGRFHQIRRHMKHLGHPLIGDVNYGNGALNREYRATWSLRRLALHALSIAFDHPITGERLSISVAVPDDLGGPLEALGLPRGADA